MQATDARLRSTSVVTIADPYQPDTIYRDLVNGKIMPDRTEIDKSVQAFGGCDVVYKSGMHITVNQQKVSISNEYNELFKEFLND